MELNELATGGGTAIDLNAPGEEVEGTLISVGEWREIQGKFGVTVKAPFNLVVGEEDRTLWVKKGSRLATVLGDAFKEAGLAAIVTNGTLKVRRVEDVDTSKGNRMHDFRARYTPAPTIAAGAPALDDF